MKKAELQIHRSQYNAILDQARAALEERRWFNAVELAVSSWQFIDGMMQYERKHGGREFCSIETIDIVLRLAPFLFDVRSLDQLAVLLKSQRRIDKNASADIAENLSKSRSRLHDIHRLWNHVQHNPGTRLDQLLVLLGGDEDRWQWIAEGLDRFGLIQRTADNSSFRLMLSTRMDDIIHGKCASCGVIVKGHKSKLIRKAVCPQCGESTNFVILARPLEQAHAG